MRLLSTLVFNTAAARRFGSMNRSIELIAMIDARTRRSPRLAPHSSKSGSPMTYPAYCNIGTTKEITSKPMTTFANTSRFSFVS